MAIAGNSWYCEDITQITKNTDLFQTTSFKECSNVVVGKAYRVTINFIKSSDFYLSHRVKNIHRTKVIPMTYTLKKKFIVAATFEGF